jgi:hypothetical protein
VFPETGMQSQRPTRTSWEESMSPGSPGKKGLPVAKNNEREAQI